MKNSVYVSLGVMLALVAGVHAASYKIEKVGSKEEQSFDLMYNNQIVTEASPDTWVAVSPIVPKGKMLKTYTVFKSYGETEEEQEEAPVEKFELSFLMPNYDVYVKASYESLRFLVNLHRASNGRVTATFNDRLTDRTKPGTKVTVTPTADKGYKLSSITVSKYLDPNTTITCNMVEPVEIPMGPGSVPAVVGANGSCTFDMPEFDVDIRAKFVADSVAVPDPGFKDKKFDVTYELNGGYFTNEAVKTFVCDSLAKLPTPVKEGFDFVGWSLKENLDNVYNAITSIDGNTCTNTKVYAIWSKAGTCPEQKAIAVDNADKYPVCANSIKCALIYNNATSQNAVCNGIIWTTDLSILPSSSSVASSSSVESSSSETSSSSSVEQSSSSVVPSSSSVEQSSSSVEQSSSSVVASSSSVEQSSSSAVPPSSSSTENSSSSATPVSSSSQVESSSSATQTKYYAIHKVGTDENKSFKLILNGNEVTEAKQGDWPEISPIAPAGKKYKSFTLYDEYGDTPESQKERTTGKLGMRFTMPDHEIYVKVNYEVDVPASSSSVASSSSAKPASSSAVASSSSAKPASSSTKASSSSAKPASSSTKASSSSAKPASSSAKVSSSSVEVVVESVKTEEDLPNCTDKRENMTYYVSELKKVFVCKAKKWTQFDPNGIPTIVRKANFAAVVNGHQLQISGVKVGAQVSLFDMQGRVIYNGRADAANFSLNVARTGSFLLRVGSQQQVVNIR